MNQIRFVWCRNESTGTSSTPMTTKEIRLFLNNPTNASLLDKIYFKSSMSLTAQEIRIALNDRNNAPLIRCATHLCLAHSDFTILPPEIGKFTALTTLNLSFNKIEEVPPEIGNLIVLSELDLSYNSLKNIPPEIGKLLNLTHLTLRCNSLNSLPIEISQLKALKVLDVSYNAQLRQLPNGFGNLYALEQLYYDFGQVGIPPEVDNLPKLQLHPVRW